MDDLKARIFKKHFAHNPNTLSASAREIQYLDTAPPAIVTQVPLVEYFERIKRHRADRWQKDLCSRLQIAAEKRHIERYWGIIHAEGQLGKTSIISQCFPAWLFGHDPLFRFALAMYNIKRSQTHSAVVIQIMQSNVHKDMFPDKDGWLFADFESHSKVGRVTSKAGWLTNARRELNDGQLSFNPVGLQSGLVGSGFDWLGIDDPYRESKEAFSEQIRENLQNFYIYTVMTRTSLHSCITGMFHRYSPEDLAGYLLDTGDFDYVRYATQADGDYIHESTGKRYPDPLAREEGEYISPERRPPKYYDKPRKNNRVWLSMFQGRPSSEEGDFFNVGKLTLLNPDKAAERQKECVAVARSYDIAATDEAGAYSIGIKGGIRANGKHTVFEMWRERVDTAARFKKQKELAARDGADVVITHPLDPGAAGKGVVWYVKQLLKDYTVVEMPTTGSKETRAINPSAAVNSGDVEIVEADWNREFKKELRDFPLSEYKDIVDAFSDNYNYLYQTMIKGKIVTGYKPQRNLINYKQFGQMFPYRDKKGRRLLKVPAAFTIYAAVKTSADANLPNCGAIVARASVKSGLEDTLFILGEYKEYDQDPQKLFDWLADMIKLFCVRADTKNTTIWLHPDSKHFAPVIRQKLDVGIAEFEGDDLAGYAELNWYFIPTADAHPANAAERAARMYGIIKPGMEIEALTDGKPSGLGLYHLRREIATCGFTEKGEPSATCQVLDVLRMCVAGFATRAADLTERERYERYVGEVGLVKEDEEISPERQQQVMDRHAKARARLDYDEGLTDELPEEFDDKRGGELIHSWEQLGVEDLQEWLKLTPEEQQEREEEAIERAMEEE